MKTWFKASLWMALFTLSLLSCTSRTERRVEALDTFLDSLKNAYAPDTRTALWTLEIQVEEGIFLRGKLAQPEAYSRIDQAIRTEFPGVVNEVELLTLPKGLPVNGVVNNSAIHLRRGPSSTTEMVSQALLGSPVRILKEEAGKRLIQVADGYIGYVNSPEVSQLDKEGLQAYKTAEKIVYTRQYGFAYSQPDASAIPVSDLVIGNLLVSEGRKDGYYRVRYPDGRQAYVAAGEALPAREVFGRQPGGKDLVATAVNFMGIPYLWGGTSAKNIDCSGLVSNVFFMHGLQMPRDADMQSHCGRILSTEWDSTLLEAGDLLFFGRKATAQKKERVSHVAMYMGGGQFIHAAGHRERVGINHMDSTQAHFIDNYPAIFLRSVRILGEEGGDFRPVMENSFYAAIFE